MVKFEWLKTNITNIIMDGVSISGEKQGSGNSAPGKRGNQEGNQGGNDTPPDPSWPVLKTVMASSNNPKSFSLYPNVYYKDGAVAGCKPSQDKINPNLLEDIQKAAKETGVTPTITTAITGHHPGSRHNPSGQAVDLAIFNGKGYGSKQEAKNNGIYNDIVKFVKALESMGYALNSESGNSKAVLWFGFPNHENHVHVSNKIKS
jgi:hypothetical protein